MKKHISTIMLVIIFFIGLFVFLYPTISDYYNKKVGSYAISQYDEELKNTTGEQIESILEKGAEYNKKLLTKSPKYINGAPKDEEYSYQLRVPGNDMMGYIEIDKIKVKLPIYHGTAEPVLQKGIGHIEGSALPISGIGNHSVLSGHRGLPSAKLFTNLDKIELGDEIVIKVLGKTTRYTVTKINIVEPQDVSLLEVEADKDLITLVTCTPYGVNSHRLLVRAENSKYVKSSDIVINNDAVEIDSMYIAPIIAVPMLAIILIGVIGVLIYKRKK